MYFPLLPILYSKRATLATTQEDLILTGSLFYNQIPAQHTLLWCSQSTKLSVETTVFPGP